MKILPLVNEIRNDVVSSGIRLRNATSSGYDIANRAANIYRHGKLHQYLNITRSVGDKIIENTTRKDLPYMAGAIGMFIPLPLASPILLGLGFLARLTIPSHEKVSEGETINV